MVTNRHKTHWLSQTVGRAKQKEYNARMQATARAWGGKKGAESASSSSLLRMSLDEAKQILNVTHLNNAEQLTKNYKNLMKVNYKATGDSFYVQPTVYRAKQRNDSEIGPSDSTKEKVDKKMTNHEIFT
ncbi:unnamed protein product [Clavelina lepadiformis]|uniref:Uncharacterized protein n=1 Tax=Clavelina lepadiformis TaxID=159417 RepID=A0ABP0GGJ0_CLALP